MCGLCGVIQVGPSPAPLQPGVDLLRHRGPDDEGQISRTGPDISVALGHTRLAINDVSRAGHQPMLTDDGAIAMVFNGEIYNYPELRAECLARGRQLRSHMDGEVILHLWDMDGISCLGRLNGIFAIAIVDFRANVATLARDPLGVKPLFYCSGAEGELFFASELRSLKALAGDLGGFDAAALAQFLTFLWIPDPRTPYLGARSVEPGAAVQWERGRVTIRRYGAPLVPRPTASRVDDDEVVEEGEAQLDAAVKRQLLSDVPIGLMASGGIDSGLLWSAADTGLARAFCIEWRSEREGLGEDAAAVRRCQEVFGTPVTMLSGESWDVDRMPESGDLIADPAFELTRSIAASARAQGCKVLLSGQGGDELLGGYRRHQVARLLDRLSLPNAGSDVAARAIGRVAPRSVRAEYAARLVSALGRRHPFERYLRLCSYSTAQQRASILGTAVAEVDDEVVFARHLEVFESLPQDLSFFRKAMTVDLRVYLPGLGLAYADRAAMSEGVEVRVPLLDLRFVDWCMTLPDHFLVRRRTSKWLAKQIAARRLPSEVVFRPKRGFGAPVEHLNSTASGAPSATRQERYLDRAAQLLARYLDDDATPNRLAS